LTLAKGILNNYAGTSTVENNLVFNSNDSLGVNGVSTTLDLSGSVTVRTGSSLQINGAGTVVLDSVAPLTESGAVTVRANVARESGDATGVASGGSMPISGSVTLESGAAITVESGGFLTDRGNLTVESGASLTDSFLVTVDSGGV